MKLSLIRIMNEELSKQEKEEIKKKLLSSSSPSLQKISKFLSAADESLLSQFGIFGKTPIASGGTSFILPSESDDAIVKLTDVGTDFQIADKLKGVSGVVPVRNRHKINTDDGDLFAIIADKMNPLDNNKTKILSQMEQLWKQENELDASKRDWERSNKRYKILKSYFQKNRDRIRPSDRKVMIQLLKMIDSLHKNNISFNDFKSSQFMLDRNGNLVLVDLGALRDCSDAVDHF